MKINAVIPVRYRDCFDGDGCPKFVLRDKVLWEHTLDQAVREADVLDRVIVAYDDARFRPCLTAYLKHPKFAVCLRPPRLSGRHVPTLDVLAHVGIWARENGMAADYLMLLEITHPLRPEGIIRQVAGAMRDRPVDAMVTVYPVHYNYWRHDEKGRIVRLQGHGDNAKIRMHQEVAGICSLFRTDRLRTGTPFGDEIDMVSVERFWATIDVRDHEGLWLAEAYLKKIREPISAGPPGHVPDKARGEL